MLDENVAKKLSEKSIAVQTILNEQRKIQNVALALEKGFFAGSECASPEEIRQLVKYLEDKQVYETVLEYRGSLHGWGYKDFH